MNTTNTFLKAQKAFLGRDFENSIEAFSDALKHGEQPLYSHLNRGIAYLKTGRFVEAVTDFDFIITHDAVHEWALFYRGVAHLNLEHNEEAGHDLDRAIALNPDRSASYLARGLAHYFLGHWKEAERDIHNDHVLNNLELGEFIEEYIISNSLFQWSLDLFGNDREKWRLSLTEDEVQRMFALH